MTMEYNDQEIKYKIMPILSSVKNNHEFVRFSFGI